MFSCASVIVARICSTEPFDASSLARMSLSASCTFPSCSFRRPEIADNASNSFVWKCSVSVFTLLRCWVAVFMNVSTLADSVCVSVERVLPCVLTAFTLNPKAVDLRSMLEHQLYA